MSYQSVIISIFLMVASGLHTSAGPLEVNVPMDEANSPLPGQGHPLSNDELLAAINGAAMTLDPSNSANRTPFKEVFHKDGSWTGTFQKRALSMEKGSWRVDGDKFCVANEKIYKTLCRNLFRTDKSGTFITNNFSLSKNITQIYVVLSK